MKKQYKTMDEYIGAFSKDVQSILENIRKTIRKTEPEAVETMSYGMPTFTLNGKAIVFFAAWKDHIALYHIPSGTEAFQRELSPYLTDKGAVRLPLDKPIPYDLVEKIIRFRMEEKQE